MARKEIDLNETTRKQGLMTDEEFEALLDEVNRMEDGTAMMTEGLDLASSAVGEGEEAGAENDSEGLSNQPVDEAEEGQTREDEPESVTPQPEAGESDAHIEKEETEARTEVPGPVVSQVLKPKPVKRNLVLKSDPSVERPKPEGVSQRCLGKWASSKAKANTATDPVEVLSEEDRTTPTKTGEESSPTTNLEDAPKETEVVSPTPSDQGEKTVEMAEGLDLASESVGHDKQRDDITYIRAETLPTAQDKPSTQAENKSEGEKDRDEDRYQEERKRKGKAPVKKSQAARSNARSTLVSSSRNQTREPHRAEGSRATANIRPMKSWDPTATSP
ncbi:neurofilament medium polypeptide-like [Salvia splendens]|uniref:neurofilament medium polypeptide-like n=1 Tax=Salvia splendens TaxID=180675 RepID=UPI001C25443F|nr:neurofilament medium polypeptide-like [Salvia splendens]